MTQPAAYIPEPFEQAPLFLVVNEDDKLLEESKEGDWYRILLNLPYSEHRKFAADYYNSLRDFNWRQKIIRFSSGKEENESREDARQRCLFDRATMNPELPVLYTPEPLPIPARHVTPAMVAPGVTPDCEDGRKPKCFFALRAAFLGAALMGFEPEPDRVYDLLVSNLSFARVCGFVPAGRNDEYWHRHIPSRRKLQQFDQIMTDYGIWDAMKIKEVSQNLLKGVIRKENTIVGDTSHYHALSVFEMVEYTDKKGNKKRKAQSLLTKNCRCADQISCPHEWIPVDDGAGVIVKNKNKIIWGHKASFLGLPNQEILLDIIAVADSSTSDGKTFHPHVEHLLKTYPVLKAWIDVALYDSACDDRVLKRKFEEDLGIVLKTSLNSRRIKTITDLPQKCMEKLTPAGKLFCAEGHEMEFKGCRTSASLFIYGAPVIDGDVACSRCPRKPVCCPNAGSSGRTTQIPFSMLPHVNPDDPYMATRFKSVMKKRTSVERMIKRVKCDLGSDRLGKRGNKSFQAYLDKTLIAYHILLRN
jgi:hypothetical protein